MRKEMRKHVLLLATGAALAVIAPSLSSAMPMAAGALETRASAASSVEKIQYYRRYYYGYYEPYGYYGWRPYGYYGYYRPYAYYNYYQTYGCYSPDRYCLYYYPYW